MRICYLPHQKALDREIARGHPGGLDVIKDPDKREARGSKAGRQVTMEGEVE